MSYIDDILGGVIDEGLGLVRGYVNDALDPIGEILIDAMQAIGILDSMESEWQKFNKEEISKYSVSRTKSFVPPPPNPYGFRSVPTFSDSYKRYAEEMLQAPHQADAQAHFNLLRQVPQPIESSPQLRRPPPIKGGWTDALKTAYEDVAASAAKQVVGRFDHRTRTFLDNLDEEETNNLLSSQQEGYRHNHKLELVGKLEFAYPKDSFGHSLVGSTAKPPGLINKYGSEFNVFSLPFFENPKISESRSATYAENVIVNRNEPYKVWMGAKGKAVNLDFNISMPNLITFATQQFGELVAKSIHPSYILQKILTNLKDLNKGKNGEDRGDNSLEYNLIGEESFYNTTNSILNNPDHPLGLKYSNSNSQRRAQIIIYTVYLLDMIRTSVIGSTKTNLRRALEVHERKNSHPPITFLTFGALYHEEPFIVKSYSLEFDGKHGYEELSLLPRTINVKLKLESYDQIGDAQSWQGLSSRYRT